MRSGTRRNMDGELLSIEQVCQLANLGLNSVRKIAEESGAVLKIGRAYRINRKVFFDYIEANCK